MKKIGSRSGIKGGFLGILGEKFAKGENFDFGKSNPESDSNIERDEAQALLSE